MDNERMLNRMKRILIWLRSYIFRDPLFISDVFCCRVQVAFGTLENGASPLKEALLVSRTVTFQTAKKT